MKKWALLFPVVALQLWVFAFAPEGKSGSPDATDYRTAATTADERTPVLVELFTSEGCSSCPPADELLAWLESAQPVPGAEIIVLSEHVDYWNYLGWRDPYSSSRFSARQTEYGRVLGVGGAYTPQMVIDGREELVGSDSRKAQAVIAHVARKPKARITLSVGKASPVSPGQVPLLMTVESLPQKTDVRQLELVLAITEDNLGTDVRRGENAGRQLTHRAVVRRLDVVGRLKTSELRTYSMQVNVQPRPDWDPDQLRAVVFLQHAKSRLVLGAAVTKLYPG